MSVVGQLSERGQDRGGNRFRMELRAGMPFAGPEQVGNLAVRSLGHELADRVAPVQEPTAGAVDEGDRALGADDPGQAGRVGPVVDWLLGGWSGRRRAGAPAAGAGVLAPAIVPSLMVRW